MKINHRRSWRVMLVLNYYRSCNQLERAFFRCMLCIVRVHMEKVHSSHLFWAQTSGLFSWVRKTTTTAISRPNVYVQQKSMKTGGEVWNESRVAQHFSLSIALIIAQLMIAQLWEKRLKSSAEVLSLRVEMMMMVSVSGLECLLRCSR